MDQLNLEFTKHFGLNEEKCARLDSEISRLAGEISKHRTYSQRAADHHMRKAALETIVKRFADLRSAIQKHKSTLEPMLRGEFLTEFGKQLSYYGYAAITGSSMGHSTGLSSRRQKFVSAQEMERRTEAHRANIADQMGLHALDGHLAAIAFPLSSMLALESAVQGGRPQYIYRNYVIRQLGRLHSEIFGRPLTMTVNGEFWKLCRDTLLALGIETGNLKNAIPRALEAAGLKQKPRTPKKPA